MISENSFSLSGLVEATDYLWTFIYGFVLRMLSQFGLHHIFYLPFWTTALGGSEVINGQFYEGILHIFFAQLANSNTQHYYIGTARFMSWRFITMMFGRLGVCLAMYHAARPENRKWVRGLLLLAALTSFLTSITKPIEFSFPFLAPTLQGEAKTILTVGALVSALLLFIPLSDSPFRFQTPGWEEMSAVSKAPLGSQLAQTIIQTLGRREDIEELYCCATRLRVTIRSAQLVDDAFAYSKRRQLDD